MFAIAPPSFALAAEYAAPGCLNESAINQEQVRLADLAKQFEATITKTAGAAYAAAVERGDDHDTAYDEALSAGASAPPVLMNPLGANNTPAIILKTSAAGGSGYYDVHELSARTTGADGRVRTRTEGLVTLFPARYSPTGAYGPAGLSHLARAVLAMTRHVSTGADVLVEGFVSRTAQLIGSGGNSAYLALHRPVTLEPLVLPAPGAAPAASRGAYTPIVEARRAARNAANASATDPADADDDAMGADRPNPWTQSGRAIGQLLLSRIDVPRLLADIERALDDAARSPDVMQQLDAYSFAADTLARHSGASIEECLGWLVAAFGERDASALACLAQRRPPAPPVAQRLATMMLEYRVAYRKAAAGKRWERELTLYVLSQGVPMRAQRTDEVEWSDLPEPVRAQNLGARRDEINFTLWPVAAEAR